MIKISVITSLFHCQRYLASYFNAVDKIINKDECEFLLLFNDPTQEEERIIQKHIKGKPYFKYFKIAHESLYATWNRGIKLAQGEYIANWNVDDCREPDSLQRQAKALDQHPECAFAYGDTISIKKINDKKGIHNIEKQFNNINKPLFKHRFFISCFPMWRKSIHKQVGYYDEQLKLVGDFEFQVRVSYFFDFIKVDGILGYFFSGGEGTRLSEQTVRQSVENNLVYLRYGAYFKVNILRMRETIRQKSIYFILNDRESIPIETYLPNLKKENKSKRILWFNNILYKLPIDILKFIKHDLLQK